MNDFDIYYYGIPIIIALITGELCYSYIYKKNYYKKEDSLASLGLLAGNVIVSLLSFVVMVILLPATNVSVSVVESATTLF